MHRQTRHAMQGNAISPSGAVNHPPKLYVMVPKGNDSAGASMKRVLKLEKGKYLPSCHMCCCCEHLLCREGHGQPAVEEGLPGYALRLQQAADDLGLESCQLGSESIALLETSLQGRRCTLLYRAA